MDQPVDLTCLLNVNGINTMDAIVWSTKQGGYVLEHNWSSAPREAFRHPDLQFVGVIRKGKNGEERLVFDTTVNIADYLEAEIDELGGIPKKLGDEAYIFRRNFHSAS